MRRWSTEALYKAMIRSGKQVEIRALDVNSGLNRGDLNSAPGGVIGTPDAGESSTEETIRAWSSRLAMARGSLAGIFIRSISLLPE